MNCTVPFDRLGFSKITTSGTADVYLSPDTQFVAKRVTRYKVHDPFSREVCLLDKLKDFQWSPKLVCVGTDYFVTHAIQSVECAHYPPNYDSQVAVIVRDMRSLGIRHNDMRKDGKNTDIVVDPHGVVHLTDFGWGTVNRSLAIDCVVHGRRFHSPATRPRNAIIDQGFANHDETQHTRPCHRFVSFRQRNGAGSQKETPRLQKRGNAVVVTGYQHFEMNTTNLRLWGHRKYGYLERYLVTLSRPCSDPCHFLDIGSNTGLVSFLAERAGFATVQALDHDAEAIRVVQEAASAVHSRVRGRVFSFGDPLPDADVVFCGALIHWVFCLTADFRGDFGRIFAYLIPHARRYIVIEWVDPEDPAVRSFQHVKRCAAAGLTDQYSYASFKGALEEVAHVVDEASFGTRRLVTARPK